MSLQAINLGVAPSGEGGDTNRQANEKNNANHTHLEALAQRSEAVAGGDGFVDASGEITLDLAEHRAFHFTVTGNITSWSFTNAPTYTAQSPVIRIVFKQDATGGRTITGGPTLKFRDRRSLSDLNTSADAVNELHVWHDGTELVAALVENGRVDLDPVGMSFESNTFILYTAQQTETLDLSDVSNLEEDGTAGTGSVSFKRNNGADLALEPQEFTSGQVLKVTMAGSTAASSVSIPRWLV